MKLKEAKNRFSRWRPWRPSWISDQIDFSYFLSTSHPDASYQVSSQLAFWFRSRSENIDFQDGRHLGFPSLTIVAIFDLQDTPMLPTKFRINWPFSSGEEGKIDFHPDATKIRVNWPFGSGKEAKNRFSRWRPWRPSWISNRNDFSYFLSTSHPDASY